MTDTLQMERKFLQDTGRRIEERLLGIVSRERNAASRDARPALFTGDIGPDALSVQGHEQEAEGMQE